MAIAMTVMSPPRNNPQQVLSSPGASMTLRPAAASTDGTAAPASASSTAAQFASLLADLASLAHPAAASAPALPASSVDGALGQGGAAVDASKTSPTATGPALQNKSQAKPGQAGKSAAERPAATPPDVTVAATPAQPMTAAAIAAPPGLVTAKPGGSTANPAAEAATGPARQAIDTYSIAPGAPELSAPGRQAEPAAGSFLEVLPPMPAKAAADTANAPQPVIPSPLGVNPGNGAQTAAAGPATKASATQPSQQLAPALVQLTHAGGGGQLTLQLNPGELGRVHIQIDRAADGSASVHVTADRPETLQLLVADQAQLHHALDSAGLPQDGRTLSLSLTRPDASAGDGFGAGAGGNGPPADERQNGQQGRPSSPGSADDEPARWSSGIDVAMRSPSATVRLRAGVDITA